MKREFELFTRCLGLALVCLGAVFAVKATVEYFAPAPEPSPYLDRLMQDAVSKGTPPDGIQASLFMVPSSLTESLRWRVFLRDLLACGAGPAAIGLFLLVSARPLGGLFYPGVAGIPAARAPQPPPSPPPATKSPGPARAPDPESRYAPPQNRS